MNRKDFRPNDSYSSMSNSDRKAIRSAKRKQEIERTSISLEDNKKQLAKQERGEHHKKYMKDLKRMIAKKEKRLSRIGGKSEYASEVNDEKNAQKDYKQLAKEHPEHKTKINNIIKDEHTHQKEFEEMDREKIRVKDKNFSGRELATEYDLKPQHDSRASFYGKAKVRDENGRLILRSYNTDVAYIEDGKAVVTNTQSPTTVRHVKEFLLQNGYKADTKKQIEKDYCKK